MLRTLHARTFYVIETPADRRPFVRETIVRLQRVDEDGPKLLATEWALIDAPDRWTEVPAERAGLYATEEAALRALAIFHPHANDPAAEQLRDYIRDNLSCNAGYDRLAERIGIPRETMLAAARGMRRVPQGLAIPR